MITREDLNDMLDFIIVTGTLAVVGLVIAGLNGCAKAQASFSEDAACLIAPDKSAKVFYITEQQVVILENATKRISECGQCNHLWDLCCLYAVTSDVRERQELDLFDTPAARVGTISIPKGMTLDEYISILKGRVDLLEMKLLRTQAQSKNRFKKAAEKAAHDTDQELGK